MRQIDVANEESECLLIACLHGDAADPQLAAALLAPLPLVCVRGTRMCNPWQWMS